MALSLVTVQDKCSVNFICFLSDLLAHHENTVTMLYHHKSYNTLKLKCDCLNKNQPGSHLRFYQGKGL